MRRTRLFTILALLALCLSSAGVAAAKPGGPGNNHGNGNGGAKPPKARITWSVPSVEQSLAAGGSAKVTVTLTSSADVANLTLAPNGGLARVLTVEPASFASLKAGETATVTLTFIVPAEGAHCQGGVLKARSGKRAVPSPLQIKLTVPGAEGCED